MSPIDDELRSALSSRTESAVLSPDFVTGVERRARRMRRNRVTASIAGSALAVAALGVGGPMLASSLTATTPSPVDRASSAPSPAPEPTSPFALDPASPWPYRGVPLEDLGDGTVESVRVQLAATKGVPVDDVDLSPLYGRRAGDPRQLELLFVAQVRGATAWGVARTGEAGPEIVQETALLAGTVALAAALPDDDGPRLLVLTSPEARRIEYSAGLDSAPDDWQRTVVLGAGVGETALIPNSRDDRYRVLDRRGRLLVDTLAPEPVTTGAGTAPADPPS